MKTCAWRRAGVNRERTSAKQRAFKIQYPTRQKFLKTDVAKWENSWTQKPWLVSRGAEKNFRAFMAEQGGKVPTEDIRFVQRLLAKGILFRATERIVTEQHFGGYRANIVTHTIAKLCNSTSQRLDLDRIWKEQVISDATAEALAEISVLVHKVIIDPPTGSSNVGEWTKKEASWARVVGLDWDVPESLTRELLDVSKAARIAHQDKAAGISEQDAEAIARVSGVSSESWLALSKWAKETGNLQPWQRSLAFSIGRVLARGAEPSSRQAVQGVIILDKSLAVGFRP